MIVVVVHSFIRSVFHFNSIWLRRYGLKIAFKLLSFYLYLAVVAVAASVGVLLFGCPHGRVNVQGSLRSLSAHVLQ